MRKAWGVFEEQVRYSFSEMWNVSLTAKPVLVGNTCPKIFDMVSDDKQFVGDVKWLSYTSRSARSIDNIAHYIWLLQKVSAKKTFLVFNMAAWWFSLPYLIYRYWAIIPPVNVYLFDESTKEIYQANWNWKSSNGDGGKDNGLFDGDMNVMKGCLIERRIIPNAAYKETWGNLDNDYALELWKIH